jgi:hypothetical protein
MSPQTLPERSAFALGLLSLLAKYEADLTVMVEQWPNAEASVSVALSIGAIQARAETTSPETLALWTGVWDLHGVLLKQLACETDPQGRRFDLLEEQLVQIRTVEAVILDLLTRLQPPSPQAISLAH